MPFERLPHHILERIFDELSQNERVRLGSTCRGLELIGRPTHLTYAGTDRTIDSMCQWLFHHAEALHSVDVCLESVQTPIKRCNFEMSLAAFAYRLRHVNMNVPQASTFPWLQKLTSLESLYLVGNEFNTHLDFGALKQLTSLTLDGSLTHHETYTSHVGDIAALPLLKELSVTGACYDVCLCTVALMTHLEKLVVRGDAENCYVIRDVSHLSGLINLKHIQLDAQSTIDVTHLHGLTNLTSLHLSSRGHGMDDAMEYPVHAPAYIHLANTKLPHLKVLGSSDASLAGVTHHGIEMLQMSLTSLLETVRDGMSLGALPNVTTIEILESFRESEMLEVQRRGVVEFLRSKDLVVHLFTAFDGDVCTTTMATWMNIAADLKDVHFLID